MGPAPPKVESGPPKVVECLVSMVLPPACRESVVGGLHERYTSLPSYLWEAILSVPLVIVCRTKRTTNPGLLLLEAIAIYLFFIAGAWRYDQFLEQPNAYLRLAIPVFMVLVALILVDAYSPTEAGIFYGPAAATIAFLISVLLTLAHEDWTLPSRVMSFGAGAGVVLVGSVRAALAADHRAKGAS